MLFGLRPSLRDDEHELLLLDAENSPERVREADESGFAGAAKSHDDCQLIRRVFRDTENVLLEFGDSVGDVVREVDIEEHQMALLGDGATHRTIFHHRLECAFFKSRWNEIAHGS